jgi:hypothetical protein
MSFTPSRWWRSHCTERKWGTKELKDTAVERRKARLADRKAGRVLFAGARTLKLRAIYGAPLPL